jgi:NitT/TauT family transport system substrate-binding protein
VARSRADLRCREGNPVSLLQARDKGIDVQVIAHWTSSLAEGGTDVNAVVAAAGSGIDSAAHLAGTTVTVNTLSGMGGARRGARPGMDVDVTGLLPAE